MNYRKFAFLAIGLAAVALIAYVVSSNVVKKATAARQARHGQRAKGDIWQTPVAMAPMNSDDLGSMAG